MDEQIWEIISSKLNNEILSNEDLNTLDNWLNESPSNLYIYTKLNDFVVAQRECINVDVNDAYNKVMGRVKQNKKGRIGRFIFAISSVAAAILFFFFLLTNHRNNQIIELAQTFTPNITDSLHIQLIHKDKAIVLSEVKDTTLVNLGNIKAFT